MKVSTFPAALAAANTISERSLSPSGLRTSSPIERTEFDCGGWSQGDTPPWYRQASPEPDTAQEVAFSMDNWTPDHETHLHHLLHGPRYLGRLPPGYDGPPPLLDKFVPQFDVNAFTDLIATARAHSDEEAMRTFRRACNVAAARARPEGTRATVVEGEHHGLFGIMALCMLSMSRALSQRELDVCRQRVAEMRRLVECVDALLEVKETVLLDVSRM